jgi:hypothetical protein
LTYLNARDNKENLLIIRKELCFGLQEQIPKRFGLGNEQFREDRKKLIKFNLIKY